MGVREIDTYTILCNLRVNNGYVDQLRLIFRNASRVGHLKRRNQNWTQQNLFQNWSVIVRLALDALQFRPKLVHQCSTGSGRIKISSTVGYQCLTRSGRIEISSRIVYQCVIKSGRNEISFRTGRQCLTWTQCNFTQNWLIIVIALQIDRQTCMQSA